MRCYSGCSRRSVCGLSNENIEDCPCLECLVKVNCSKLCPTREEYWFDLLEKRNSMRIEEAEKKRRLILGISKEEVYHMTNRICNNGCSRVDVCGITESYIMKCPCNECIVKPSCSMSCVDRDNFWCNCLKEEKEKRRPSKEIFTLNR